MELVIVFVLSTLQCVLVSSAADEFSPRAQSQESFYGLNHRVFSRERSEGARHLQNANLLTKAQANGNIATTLLRNFDTREIKVVYVPASIEDQGGDLHSPKTRDSGSKILGGNGNTGVNHKSTEASIPVIIIERHIGYQIPETSSSKEPELIETDGPESDVKFPTQRFPNPRDDGYVREESHKPSSRRHPFSAEIANGSPPEVPPPYHGHGEYRRRYADLDPSDAFRRDFSSFYQSEQSSKTEKPKKKTQKNTGIFVKAGRVLSNQHSPIASQQTKVVLSETKARVKHDDDREDSAPGQILPLIIIQKPSESFSSKQRLQTFSERQGGYIEGKNVVTKGSVVGTLRPSARERYAEPEPQPTLEWPREHQDSKRRRLEALLPVRDDLVENGVYFAEEAGSPAHGRFLSSAKFGKFFYNAHNFNKPVVNPLTGWVQTPAVRPRDGSRLPIYDLYTDNVPTLGEALAPTRRPEESVHKVPKKFQIGVSILGDHRGRSVELMPVMGRVRLRRPKRNGGKLNGKPDMVTVTPRKDGLFQTHSGSSRPRFIRRDNSPQRNRCLL